MRALCSRSRMTSMIATVLLADAAMAVPDCLSDDERVRAARFRHDLDRRRFTVGRSLVRTTLAAHYGCQPSAIRFRTGRNDKPEVEPPAGMPPLHFNVSHSGDLVLAGFAPCEIGVDVEQVRDSVDLCNVATEVFSTNEQRALTLTPEAERAPLFFRLWTCREALLKASGAGLSGCSRLRDELDLGLPPADDQVVIVDGRAWRLMSLPFVADHALAVALGDPDVTPDVIFL